MGRFVWGALALIAAGWTMSARAADLYGSRGAPLTFNRAQLGPDSWAGPYLGGNLGYALAPMFSYAMTAMYGWHVALMSAAVLGPVMIAIVIFNGDALSAAARPGAKAAPKTSVPISPRMMPFFEPFCAA